VLMEMGCIMDVRKDDDMNLKAMYVKAYSEKCEPQGVYSMNQFCSAISEEATIDDISDLMKLYYDRAITTEQNQFVLEVLNTVFVKSPKLAAKKIVENIWILKREEAENCISYLLIMFIYWNKELTHYFLEALVESDKSNSNCFIEELKFQINEDNDELYEQFLTSYFEKVIS